MSCIELISDIVKIEAYDLKNVSLLIPFTHDMVIQSSAVSFSGTPIVLSLKENSAQARSTLQKSEAGDLYQNTLSWQTNDNQTETLRQAGTLSAARSHLLLTTYGGTRKLIYNWCSLGRTLPDASISGTDETIAMAFSITSRFPILTLI